MIHVNTIRLAEQMDHFRRLGWLGSMKPMTVMVLVGPLSSVDDRHSEISDIRLLSFERGSNFQ